MIPQEKIAAVTRGLREAFGVAEFEDISKITRGHTSSLVFRIIVRGSPYLLKIIMRAGDPSVHYTSMKTAAEAGLAPRVRYTNIEDKVSITDFVPAQPLPSSEALVRLPVLLRALHALPPFARVPFNTSCTFLIHKGPALDGFLRSFQAANILSAEESAEIFKIYEQLEAVYPRDDAEMVSSHNDLFKPDNILFDGQRLWLVDWEAAFLNDRYADLVVVANLVVANDVDERAFLQAYFGEPPDPYRLARFFLLQQLSHMFYAMAYLLQGSSVKPIDWSETAPTFGVFQRRIWAGEVNLADCEIKVVYGKVHLAKLLENARQPRFAESLEILAARG